MATNNPDNNPDNKPDNMSGNHQEPVTGNATGGEVHWLVRPDTIRKLWWGGSVLLALTVIAQLVIPVKGYFGVDDWFGFGAVYGFVCCVAMVFFAKLLGFLLKRPQDYYADELEDRLDD